MPASPTSREDANTGWRWHAVAILSAPPQPLGAEAAITRQALTQLGTGWQLDLSGHEPMNWDMMLARVLRPADHERPEYLIHSDLPSGLYRAAGFVDSLLTGALFVAPKPIAIAGDWLAARLGTPLDAEERFRLLDGRPGGARRPRGAILCFCCHVGRNEIADAIAGGCASVEAVTADTRAGSNCGRCRPEIARLIGEHRPTVDGFLLAPEPASVVD